MDTGLRPRNATHHPRCAVERAKRNQGRLASGLICQASWPAKPWLHNGYRRVLREAQRLPRRRAQAFLDRGYRSSTGQTPWWWCGAPSQELGTIGPVWPSKDGANVLVLAVPLTAWWQQHGPTTAGDVALRFVGPNGVTELTYRRPDLASRTRSAHDRGPVVGTSGVFDGERVNVSAPHLRAFLAGLRDAVRLFARRGKLADL
jgi:hypothetical protein